MRKKTKYRHITPEGKKIRVSEENGEYFIGDTNERAEGKMVAFRKLHFNNGNLPPKRHKSDNFEDWWHRSNLDGSFAYEGVTDNF